MENFKNRLKYEDETKVLINNDLDLSNNTMELIH